MAVESLSWYRKDEISDIEGYYRVWFLERAYALMAFTVGDRYTVLVQKTYSMGLSLTRMIPQHFMNRKLNINCFICPYYHHNLVI